MKRLPIILIFLASLGACATNSGDGKVADTNSGGRQKVCSYERSTNAGSRMERVCRWEDASEN